MVERICFKKCSAVIFFLLAVTGLLLFYQKHKLKDEKILDRAVLDFGLKEKLSRKVKTALSLYPTIGWEKTYKLLDAVRWDCKRGQCDPEIFFNEAIDDLATTLHDNREFISAGVTLGIIYSGNWQLADVDLDGKNEIIALQRDALNISYTLLKIINFRSESRVTTFKLSQGYFSSPNSSGLGTLPLEIRDINSDGQLEILVYVSPGRGGADLNIFTYSDYHLNLVYKKDDIDYPEYTFSTKDRDGSSEIAIEGYRNGERVKELVKL